MLLEKYVDLGILFERILAEAERGNDVKIVGATIEIGQSGPQGWDGSTKVTFAAIEGALGRVNG